MEIEFRNTSTSSLNITGNVTILDSLLVCALTFRPRIVTPGECVDLTIDSDEEHDIPGLPRPSLPVRQSSQPGPSSAPSTRSMGLEVLCLSSDSEADESPMEANGEEPAAEASPRGATLVEHYCSLF
jgi:hypothetical protein